ncbi:MAG TPA: hypothetical protein VNB49_10585 [Candidatus Dormibacteraeota bacterium]|nr:hypothetical protein [Candidatus Dormibacteraeota bacterium]
MSFEDWDDQFQDFYDHIPGTGYLDADEQRTAEALFETGFTLHAEDYEAMGLTEDQVDAIREEFFDYLGIDEADFDWEGWREAMGYE